MIASSSSRERVVLVKLTYSIREMVGLLLHLCKDFLKIEVELRVSIRIKNEIRIGDRVNVQ